MDTRHYMVTILRTLTIGLALFALSCAKDPFQHDSRLPEAGVTVKVELNFRIPRFDNPQKAGNSTGSSAAVYAPSDRRLHMGLVSDTTTGKADEILPVTRSAEAPLYNLWVFQFSADGTARKAVRVSTGENPIYETQTIEVDLLTGSDQTIYMLALGKQYGETDLSGIRSLDELKSTAFDFVTYRNGLPVPVIQNAEDVPYRGSCSNLSIIQLEEDSKGYVDYRNSDGFSGAISLKALVTLVTLDFSYHVEDMTPFSISLNNVPATFGVDDSVHKPSQFVNLPATLLKPADLEEGKRLILSWYVAPNRQGVVPSITSETDRYFYYKNGTVTPTGTAPRFGTHIDFWASNDAVPDDYAIYYLFLGSNTTNDFNIHPHSHYRYRTDINTADDLNDKRILYKTLKQSVDFSASARTYPSPNLLRSGYVLDSHADTRPMEITALRGKVSVEILPGSENGLPQSWPGSDVPTIDPASSWLKLSTYPNYTAALEAHRQGDPNALATSIELDASIPGLFRLYLYSDEYERYVLDNPTKDEYKRSLFVRFTFRTETDKSEVYTVRMDQVPAFYLGEFGGEPSMTNGEFRYPKGLVLETLNEHKKYSYLSFMPYSFPQYGAYATTSSSIPVPSDNDVKRYGAYDIYSGRRATILMSENRYRLSPIAAGHAYFDRMEEPRYVNGHVDLYQYKYYTNDGFAQRWCYDKNRDTNGNGYLDDEEIVWYMPSQAQIEALGLNIFTTATDYIRDKNAATGLGESYLHSTTMYNVSNREGIGLYTFDAYNVSSTTSLNMRCVRDVEPVEGGPGGVRYYSEDNYAVIDASGLMEGVAENRVNNPQVVILPGAGDDPSYTGRVIRHYTKKGSSTIEDVHSIDRKVSRRFRVAPCDVDKNGNPVAPGKYASMTWAEAAGYVTEANTLPVTSDKTAVAETGCSAYRGIDGTDVPGTWRLPTIREIILMGIMDQALAADNTLTGYIPLYYFDTTNFISRYWTASEAPDGTTESEKNRAYFLSAFGRVKSAGGAGNSAAWRLDVGPKSRNYQNLARCIQDLP